MLEHNSLPEWNNMEQVVLCNNLISFSSVSAFHICVGDGAGGLTKYSFLCPNGTLFNQQYFVCDWWFNVDCDRTEHFYSLNEELHTARQSAVHSTTQDISKVREVQSSLHSLARGPFIP